jgi:XK-related protein
LALARNDSIRTSEDAKVFLHGLRKFQACNHERTRVGDVDLYFGAMPQLILQSYIAVEVAKETGIMAVTWTSWLSLCLSSFSLLRYEPTARQSKKGIIIDIETVLEPAAYDYIMENIFDLMSVVPRAVTIGCFLTIEPSYAVALAFFSLHLLITFLWFWSSAPNRIPGYRSTNRDFRGQRRDRSDD